MMDMLDIYGNIREATREEVAAWTAEVIWEMMGKTMVKNSWRKMGYNWFEGVVEEDVVEDDNGNNGGNKAYSNGNKDNNDEDREIFSNGNDSKED
jgi:hypothetical protein